MRMIEEILADMRGVGDAAPYDAAAGTHPTGNGEKTT